MIYIEPPKVYKPEEGEASLFLGGGITACKPWRHMIVEAKPIRDSELVILNPERAAFDVDDKSMSIDQIHWEHEHLILADAITFWFCAETLCPITLYELGAWAMTDKPLFVGCDPHYKRAFDVQVQLGLTRPDVQIVYSPELMVGQIMFWLQSPSSKKDRA